MLLNGNEAEPTVSETNAAVEQDQLYLLYLAQLQKKQMKAFFTDP